MALVDFHQLAVLYNLRRCDAEFLSKHSYPPMPVPVPPGAHSSSSHTFAVPRTPTRRQSLLSGVHLTPISRGSSIRTRQEGDTDRVDGYDRADYEDYIREDLSSRVFVDYEVFMKHVLHVPDDWKTRWGPAIKMVKADAEFKEHHEKYCGLCGESGTLEKDFYPVLVDMANDILDVLSRHKFKGILHGKRQYYHVSDPEHLRGGVMSKKNLAPDIVLLHEDRVPPQPWTNTTLHWANPLHILEVKPYDNALCDGNNIPGLIVDGKCAR